MRDTRPLSPQDRASTSALHRPAAQGRPAAHRRRQISGPALACLFTALLGPGLVLWVVWAAGGVWILGQSLTAVLATVRGISTFNLVLCVPAIAIGHYALSDIKHSDGALRGRWIALLGLVAGYFDLAVYLVLLVVLHFVGP